MNLDRVKQIGVRAAYRAGERINQYFGKAFRVTKKGVMDLVTEADFASEEIVLATIREAFPDHAILAEESGASNSPSPDLWIIDPLDGTTNFAHGLPIFSVSIAYSHNNQIMLGVVFNPINGELFTAVRGGGAALNGEAIHVSATATVGDSLLVTGFPYSVRTACPPLPLNRFERCLTAAQGIRRLGSAALDLCYVACGRFDGFWEEQLKPWDTAAGMLIATEAGGRVTDFADHLFNINDKQLLATNGAIHAEMIGLLNLKDCA
ncbi:MAG: inositol monophosphatase family protein [Desulfobacteraceae bacterium]|nr:inositol monophosphatase family protein [Desulfobacteraceae bacterium]